jgi:hypothetical protein
MKPNKNLSLDAYCDSDFAGVWHQEFAHLRDSCLSCTGFIIVLAGVPITGPENYKLKSHSAQQKPSTLHSVNAAELYYLCVES